MDKKIVDGKEISNEDFNSLKEDQSKGRIRLKEIGKNTFKILKKLLG